MALTDVQAALARAALIRLDEDEDFAHPMATIERIAGKAAADEVRAREAEYRNYNADVTGNTAGLSADAAGYWADWLKMYQAGCRFHAVGSSSKYPAWGKKVSLMCERLEETFEARVPDEEKGKFLVYDPQRLDGGNWDDRWHACVDWFPPVLRAELLGDARLLNPKGRAQREALTGLLNPLPAPSIISPMRSTRLRELARKLDQ